MKISHRLMAMANMIAGTRIADIGSDHALLPIYLAKSDNYNIDKIIAVELNKGPYKAASEAIKKTGLGNKVEVRLGNGLQPIADKEVDDIVIAGMGGVVIKEILEAGQNILPSVKRLILQPMGGAAQVRHWLVENNWRIISEELILEDHRLYEIIVAIPGKTQIDEEILFAIGPVLWQNKHELLKLHLELLMKPLRNALRRMSCGGMDSNCNRYQILNKKLIMLEEKYHVCEVPTNNSGA